MEDDVLKINLENQEREQDGSFCWERGFRKWRGAYR